MILRPKPWQPLLLLVVSCGFVAIGIFIVLPQGYTLYGWLAIAFFGLCALVACAMFSPRGSSLTLTPEGIETYSLFRKTSVRWADVQEFSLVSVSFRTMVGWTFVPSYPRHRIGRKVNSVLAGVDAALPSSYGMSAESLCALLNEWRTKHAGPTTQFRGGNSVAAARN